jgi:hypothetical protein
MKHLINRNRFIIITLASFLLSCKKFIEIDPPTDQLATEAVFSDDESAIAAIRGLYSEITKNNVYIGHGALSVYSAMSADELYSNSGNPADLAYVNNSIPANSFPLLNNLWQKGYYHIYQANAILENLTKPNGVSLAAKNQIAGEARFFRALFHFHLTNLFGPIPLVMSTDYRNNTDIARSDSVSVYQQIVTDLLEAKQLVSTGYPSPEKVRVNKWAVSAFLARVYLYQKDWAATEMEASEVINSAAYQLSNLNNAFVPNNSEAILQFIPPITQIWNTSEGFSFLPSSNSVRPSYPLTDFLVNAFEPGDERKTAWIKSTVIGTTTYYYPFKYKIKSVTAGAPKTEYSVVLRLAEQYLIRAEARTQLNKFAEAQADLNTIRKRANLANTSANDKASLLQAIEKERQIEFFCEWGHRWFDLKRTGRIDTVLGTIKGSNWQSTDALYPIPQAEILSNSKLTQNPGY